MREKSQLDDMRAAIRGDLERARARREADPWREPQAEPEPTQSLRPEVPETRVPEPEREPELPFTPEPEPDQSLRPEVSETPTPEPEPEPKRGFFSRLFR
jgi:fused signal recognition particle receptor